VSDKRRSCFVCGKQAFLYATRFRPTRPLCRLHGQEAKFHGYRVRELYLVRALAQEEAR
jgi:hypothetical protein